MAMASGFAITFPDLKAVKPDPPGLLHCSTSSSSASLASFPSHTRRILYNSVKIGTSISNRGLALCPRCEIVSDVSVSDKKIEHKASSVSALELLKTSNADRYTKERSSVIVIGLNFHTAPVGIREKFSIPEAEWPRAIGELCALNHIEEAAVVSTCNRMEVYVVALSRRRGVKEVNEWMSKTSGIPVSEFSQHQLLLYNEDATRHLFEVSAGLDSLVLGEGQILAQVKQVVKTGQGVPGFGRKISGLFKHAITLGKRVRTETNISSGSVSVSSAAVDLALTKLPEPSYANAKVLVVGAGKMGTLVIKHLVAKGCTKMVVVNRSEARVTSVSKELKDVEVVYKPLTEMLACAAEADVIFTCTASETPLFLEENIQTLPSARRLFVDISVPRNVESCVADIENTHVYNVDDLKEVVAANKDDRARKSVEARKIIAEEVAQFEAWKDSLETVPTIKKLRAYAERIRALELEKCMSKMGDDISKDKKRALSDLSVGIMNKLLHGPMEHLRCDSSSNSRSLDDILQNMQALNRIFGLETDISLLLEQKLRSKPEQSDK